MDCAGSSSDIMWLWPIFTLFIKMLIFVFTDSSGMEVPCKLKQQSEKQYDAEYIPIVIGRC